MSFLRGIEPRDVSFAGSQRFEDTVLHVWLLFLNVALTGSRNMTLIRCFFRINSFWNFLLILSNIWRNIWYWDCFDLFILILMINLFIHSFILIHPFVYCWEDVFNFLTRSYTNVKYNFDINILFKRKEVFFFMETKFIFLYS